MRIIIVTVSSLFFFAGWLVFVAFLFGWRFCLKIFGIVVGGGIKNWSGKRSLPGSLLVSLLQDDFFLDSEPEDAVVAFEKMQRLQISICLVINVINAKLNENTSWVGGKSRSKSEYKFSFNDCSTAELRTRTASSRRKRLSATFQRCLHLVPGITVIHKNITFT